LAFLLEKGEVNNLLLVGRKGIEMVAQQRAKIIAEGLPFDAVGFLLSLFEMFAGDFVAIGGASISGMLP
jgi:hypothetical protein